MKQRPPLLSRTGFRLERDGLWLLQKDGWVLLPFADVAKVKFPSVMSAIVWLEDGRKRNLEFTQLSANGLSEVVGALKKASHDHRAASVPIE
jgi:hypothetical protein